MGKSEGNRPLGRPSHSWEDTIKMDLQEMGCVDTDCIDLTQNRDGWGDVMNPVMNLQDP